MRKLLYIIPVIFCAGCGAIMTQEPSVTSVKLRDFNKLYFVLKTPSESVPILKTNCDCTRSNIDPSISVACDLATNLDNIGFKLVASKNTADAVASFSIAEIRWDPLVGWVTNNAFLIIENTSTGEVIYGIRGDRLFITPTTGTFVRNISKAVRKAY